MKKTLIIIFAILYSLSSFSQIEFTTNASNIGGYTTVTKNPQILWTISEEGILAQEIIEKKAVKMMKKLGQEGAIKIVFPYILKNIKNEDGEHFYYEDEGVRIYVSIKSILGEKSGVMPYSVRIDTKDNFTKQVTTISSFNVKK